MNTSERIQFYRNPEISGIETCRVNQSRHEFPNHSHENLYAISLMEAGGSSWNGKTSDGSIVKPGEIAIIPPGLVHSGAPHKGKEATYKMIYIAKPLVMKTASDILGKSGIFPEFSSIVMRSPDIIPLFNTLYYSISCVSTPLAQDSAMISFIANLISEYGTVKFSPAENTGLNCSCKRAAEFLSADLYKKISLDDAAAEAGLSKYHFLRSFKKQTGVSPHVYRTQRRIDEAKKLMIQGLPLSQIAVDTGFTDQSHFTNQFRKYTGASPRQYAAG